MPTLGPWISFDIVSGDKVVFSSGDLATAVRATMSVPGAFAPIRVNGRLLVDGGMLDNVPVDEARKLGAERLIVVAAGTGMRSEADLNSPLAVRRTATTTSRAASTSRWENPSILRSELKL